MDLKYNEELSMLYDAKRLLMYMELGYNDSSFCDEELNEIYQFLTQRIVLDDVYLLKATELEQCKYYIEKLKSL